ncbi:antibiotic biosynthesis monooxygenase [Verrucomicrobiales bacterium]|nr:antibiotic biosynthesis monooxygenase [Verrucomicrobiales bacterium]
MPTKWIQFRVASDSITEFKCALATLEAASKLETGCVHYAAFQSLEESSLFTVIESWADDSSFEAHRIAPHTSEFKEACGDMILEKSGLSLAPVSKV